MPKITITIEVDANDPELNWDKSTVDGWGRGRFAVLGCTGYRHLQRPPSRGHGLRQSRGLLDRARDRQSARPWQDRKPVAAIRVKHLICGEVVESYCGKFTAYGDGMDWVIQCADGSLLRGESRRVPASTSK